MAIFATDVRMEGEFAAQWQVNSATPCIHGMHIVSACLAFASAFAVAGCEFRVQGAGRTEGNARCEHTCAVVQALQDQQLEVLKNACEQGQCSTNAAG